MASVTETAEAIASVLGGLRNVKSVHPYDKPMSQTRIGDLVMRIVGSSPPNVSGAGASNQQIYWDCFIALRSAASGKSEEIQKELSELISLHKTNGIMGLLYRNTEVVASLHEFGSPRFDPDGEGITIEYDVVAGDAVITLLTFTLLADVSGDD